MQPVDLLETTRAMVAEVLVLELDEVQPQSRFFADLHGESIDLLELTFLIERQLKRKVDFAAAFAGNALETDDAGVLSAAALERLRTAVPFLDTHRLPPHPTPDALKQELLTVGAIAEFIRQAGTNATVESDATLPAKPIPRVISATS